MGVEIAFISIIFILKIAGESLIVNCSTKRYSWEIYIEFDMSQSKLHSTNVGDEPIKKIWGQLPTGFKIQMYDHFADSCAINPTIFGSFDLSTKEPYTTMNCLSWVIVDISICAHLPLAQS